MKPFLLKIWEGWKKVAHAIGIFQTKLILSILYFIVIAIAAIIARLLLQDLLDRRFKRKRPLWKKREDMGPSLEMAKRQF
jgi:hypothetical protein